MYESVRVATSGSGRNRPQVLILGHFQGAGLSASCKDHDHDGSIAAALKRGEATGELGSITEAFPQDGSHERVIVVGLGEKKTFTANSFRQVAGAFGRRLDQIAATAAELCFAGPIDAANLDAHHCGSAIGETFGVMTFDHEAYKGSASPKTPRRKLALHVADHHSAGHLRDGLERGLALGESINFSRRLSMAPPNELNPTTLAAGMRTAARQVGLKCTILQGDDLLKNGLVGIETVGKASETPGCLVRLEYTPSGGGRAGKPLVLVGKTMTYDSGGLSIKTGGNMRGMKQDMDGGAAVAGAMHAIATVVKPRRRVVAYLAVAENSISDEAYRPDDIIRFMNDVTVEVTNTDAEGRLVLADALAYACSHDDPAAVIDMATLTGGVVVALGKVFAGLWSTDDQLSDALIESGSRTGERLWRLPLDEEYRKMMRSEVADIWNSAPVREAHPIQGAAFLSFFVSEGIKWAHIDIAGTHNAPDAAGAVAKGTPPGFGVRLLADLADRM